MNEGFSELNLTVCPLAAHGGGEALVSESALTCPHGVSCTVFFPFATLTEPLLYARNHVHYFPYFISYERKYGIFMSIL